MNPGVTGPSLYPTWGIIRRMENNDFEETQPYPIRPEENGDLSHLEQTMPSAVGRHAKPETSRPGANHARACSPGDNRRRRSSSETIPPSPEADALAEPGDPEIPSPPAWSHPQAVRWMPRPLKANAPLPCAGLPCWAFLCSILIAAGSAYAGYQSGIGQRTGAEATQIALQVDEQFVLGVQDMEARRFDLARQRFEYVIRYNPNYPGVTDKLAEVLLSMNSTATPTVAPTPTVTPTPDTRGVEELLLPGARPSEQQRVDSCHRHSARPAQSRPELTSRYGWIAGCTWRTATVARIKFWRMATWKAASTTSPRPSRSARWTPTPRATSPGPACTKPAPASGSWTGVKSSTILPRSLLHCPTCEMAPAGPRPSGLRLALCRIRRFSAAERRCLLRSRAVRSGALMGVDTLVEEARNNAIDECDGGGDDDDDEQSDSSKSLPEATTASTEDTSQPPATEPPPTEPPATEASPTEAPATEEPTPEPPPAEEPTATPSP